VRGKNYGGSSNCHGCCKAAYVSREADDGSRKRSDGVALLHANGSRQRAHATTLLLGLLGNFFTSFSLFCKNIWSARNLQNYTSTAVGDGSYRRGPRW
jgi:hypothetical protein